MAGKRNPQVTVPSDVYEALATIADQAGLPYPGLAVGMLVKLYGDDLLQRLRHTCSNAVETTGITAKGVDSTTSFDVKSTTCKAKLVESTAIAANNNEEILDFAALIANA